MRKFEAWTGFFCNCLGFVLLGMSILVTPQRAFADATSECSNACCASCFGSGTCDISSMCYMGCMSECINCYKDCDQKSDPPGCKINCVIAAGGNCSPGNCDTGSKCFSRTVGDCPGPECSYKSNPTECSTCSCINDMSNVSCTCGTKK